MQLQTTSPKSKFANEYTDVIFIQIDHHLKKLLQKYKGSRFYETRCTYVYFIFLVLFVISLSMLTPSLYGSSDVLEETLSADVISANQPEVSKLCQVQYHHCLGQADV